MSRKVHIALAIGLLAIAFSGCQTIGESTFACPRRDEGVRCMRASEIYESTHNSDSIKPTSPAPGKKAKKTAATTEAQTKATPAVHGHGRPNGEPPSTMRDEYGVARLITASISPESSKPVPIRTPPKIMRGWIRPWEDASNVLHGGGYVFSEIEDRTWTIGTPSVSVAPVRFFTVDGGDTSKPKANTQPAAQASTSPGPKPVATSTSAKAASR